MVEVALEREHFKSRLGFILMSAGCAIGCGNVWKFPWMVGKNGGGIFLFLYVFFSMIIGIPVLAMELAIERAAGKSANMNMGAMVSSPLINVLCMFFTLT